MKDISPSDIPSAPVIVWFRNDLRLSDNLALSRAAHGGNPVIPLFVLEDGRDSLPLGAAQGWWLHHSLQSLSAGLRKLGAALVLKTGDPKQVLDDLIAATGARTVLWNRRYAPARIERDTAIKADLLDRGLVVETFDGQLLHEPTRLKTGAGGPYRVYTPFWRAFGEQPPPRPPVDAPESLEPFDGDLASDDLADWALLPVDPDWSGGIAAEWSPGEAGAKKRLERFVGEALEGFNFDGMGNGPTLYRAADHQCFKKVLVVKGNENPTSQFDLLEVVEEVPVEQVTYDPAIFGGELGSCNPGA